VRVYRNNASYREPQVSVFPYRENSQIEHALFLNRENAVISRRTRLKKTDGCGSRKPQDKGLVAICSQLVARVLLMPKTAPKRSHDIGTFSLIGNRFNPDGT